MEIVYVDGHLIRQFLDTDFPLIASFDIDPTVYYPKFYVPKGELWIDNSFKPETDYLLKIWNTDFPLKDKMKHATAPHVDEQRWYKIEKFCQKGKAPHFVHQIQTKEGVDIVYVDGSIVRQYFDPEFMFGGHEYVYTYVPKNQIWLDILMDPRDLPHVMVHEWQERQLMKFEDKSYDVAHEFANVYERVSRRKAGGIYPEEINSPWDQTAQDLISSFKLGIMPRGTYQYA